MLVLRLKDGDWVKVSTPSGDVLLLKAYRVTTAKGGSVHLGFVGEREAFDIVRTPPKDAEVFGERNELALAREG